VSAFDDAEVGAVTGHGRAINADKGILTKMQDTWYDGQFSIMKGFENCFGSITCCSGCLSAYRREAILPCLDAWANDKFLGSEFRFGDDRHLTSYILGGSKHYINKALKAWKTKYCDSAIVFTDTPPNLKKFFRQQIRWKKSWLRVFCFNAPFYYKGRHPLAAVYFYLQVGLSLLTPIVAFRALVILPLQQQYLGMIAYIAGIFFIGLLYAFDFKVRNPGTGNLWLYRILLTIMNMFVTGYLLYYSLLTVKKISWSTR
jgi:cellulose synthase/poly-beta-1,6-N-acetylglucosamine synthase-like glycosyltransferase